MRWLLAPILWVLLVCPANTQQSYTYVAYCQITSLATAVKITTANCSTLFTASGATTVPSGAKYAEICVTGAPIRYTSDVTNAPTAVIGEPVAAASCFAYSGPIYALQLIQQSATATVDIELFQ